MEAPAADSNTDSQPGTSKGKSRSSNYNWGVDALNQPSEMRLLKLCQQYTLLRYGPGPYSQNTKELTTSKVEREASLEAFIIGDDVFSTMVGDAVVKAFVTGSAAYQKAQSEIRKFKSLYLGASTNRSGFEGGLTALQSACLECIKADNWCALPSGPRALSQHPTRSPSTQPAKRVLVLCIHTASI